MYNIGYLFSWDQLVFHRKYKKHRVLYLGDPIDARPKVPHHRIFKERNIGENLIDHLRNACEGIF